ncbi:hypothetical protein SPURM210S_00991 [Streptomyces purpurascens]
MPALAHGGRGRAHIRTGRSAGGGPPYRVGRSGAGARAIPDGVRTGAPGTRADTGMPVLQPLARRSHAPGRGSAAGCATASHGLPLLPSRRRATQPFRGRSGRPARRDRARLGRPPLPRITAGPRRGPERPSRTSGRWPPPPAGARLAGGRPARASEETHQGAGRRGRADLPRAARDPARRAGLVGGERYRRPPGHLGSGQRPLRRPGRRGILVHGFVPGRCPVGRLGGPASRSGPGAAAQPRRRTVPRRPGRPGPGRRPYGADRVLRRVPAVVLPGRRPAAQRRRPDALPRLGHGRGVGRPGRVPRARRSRALRPDRARRTPAARRQGTGRRPRKGPARDRHRARRFRGATLGAGTGHRPRGGGESRK